jgi:hypothetical protein
MQILNFNYETLPLDVADQVRLSTSEIKILLCRTASSVLEIGLRLIEIKQCLSEQTWTQWLELEFNLSRRTAQYYMAAAKTFPECANNPNLNISIGVLRKLSGVNGSPIAAAAVTALVSNGELVTDDMALDFYASAMAIEVGATVEVLGNHELKGVTVTVVEIDGPIVTVSKDGVEYSLLPAELGLGKRKKTAIKQRSRYTDTLQSHNEYISEELQELKTKIRRLVEMVRDGSVIPNDLLEELSNV